RVERLLALEAGERPVAAEYRRRFPVHLEVVETVFAGDRTAPAGPAARRAGERPGDRADRGLLLGLLALQNDFIVREALLGALTAWVADKGRPLGRILLERGALDAGTLGLPEALARQHLDRHDGDAGRSLASLSSLGELRRDLERIA